MVSNHEAVKLTMRRDHGDIYYIVELPRFAYAPVTVEQQMGSLIFYEEKNGKMTEISETPLCALYDVSKTTYKHGFFERLRS